MTKKRLKENPELKDAQVKDVMIKEVHTVDPESRLVDAIGLMRNKQVGCLPVVKDDILLGIISETDIVKIITQSELG